MDVTHPSPRDSDSLELSEVNWLYDDNSPILASRADVLQNGLIGSPCSPRDSQESSPTPQFKSVNSSVLSFLHSPTLTSIHDHSNW